MMQVWALVVVTAFSNSAVAFQRTKQAASGSEASLLQQRASPPDGTESTNLHEVVNAPPANSAFTSIHNPNEAMNMTMLSEQTTNPLVDLGANLGDIEVSLKRAVQLLQQLKLRDNATKTSQLKDIAAKQAGVESDINVHAEHDSAQLLAMELRSIMLATAAAINDTSDHFLGAKQLLKSHGVALPDDSIGSMLETTARTEEKGDGHHQKLFFQDPQNLNDELVQIVDNKDDIDRALDRANAVFGTKAEADKAIVASSEAEAAAVFGGGSESAQKGEDQDHGVSPWLIAFILLAGLAVSVVAVRCAK